MFNFKFDTGKYDKNKLLNAGEGYTDFRVEGYINHILRRHMIDGSIRYINKQKNKHTNEKKGDLLSFELSSGYFLTRNLIVGPNLVYQYTYDNKLNGVKQYNSTSKKLTYGAEALWTYSKKTNLMFGVFKDTGVENGFESFSVMGRIAMKF